MNDERPTLPPNPLAGLATAAPLDSQAREAAIERRSLIGRAKSWSWRITGVVGSVSALLFFLGGGGILLRGWRYFLNGIQAFLSAAGFSPTEPAYLSAVVRAGWLLLITGFRPIQMIGLFLYVAFFLIWVPGYFIFRRFLLRVFPQITQGPGTDVSPFSWRSLRVSLRKVRFRALFAGWLLAWILLYGDARQREHLILGLIPAGLMLVSLIIRALDRTVPRIDYSGFISRVFLWAESSVQQSAKYQLPARKTEVVSQLWVEGLTRRWNVFLLRRLRVWRRRAWPLILIESVLWPLLLLLVAVVFWAIAVKLSASPTPVEWRTALLYSLSFFLIAVPKPTVTIALPPWVSIGASLTGVVLLGLYLALLTATVPARARRLEERLNVLYTRLRLAVIRLGRFVNWLKRAEKTLP